MDSICRHCGAAMAEGGKSCGSCGRPVATTQMPEPEVLASPGYTDKPPRQPDRRLVLGLGASALVVLVGVGLLFSIRGGSDPRDVVEEFARAYEDGDCEKAADAFHYEDAYGRASEVAICKQGGDSSELVTFEVTTLDESPSDLVVPDGANDVVRVGYKIKFVVDGDSETVEDSFVVAKYDGTWKIVFKLVPPQT